MANTRISSLAAGAAVTGTDLFPVVQTVGVGPVKITATQLKTWTSASPTLVTPVLGVATGTSIALSGAALAGNVFAATGSGTISGNWTVGGALAATGASTLTGAVSCGSTLGVTGASTLTGAVSCGSTLGVTGLSTLTTLTVSSTSTLTGAVTAASSVLSTSPTAGLGYATGAGGAVTQSTNKSISVTLNKICGQITMNAASLAATTYVSFTLTNSAISATDVLHVQYSSGGTANAYNVFVGSLSAGSASIVVYNTTGGGLAEAIVLAFAVIKGATS